jgi:PIN domain nuclease of toxin-antitoxin system
VKLLLDTQCWLWWFSEPNRLNEEVIKQISDEANELWFSVASIWEIGIKVSIGKLPLPEPLESYVSSRMAELGVQLLDIKANHAVKASTLPLHHRDPFDRILIAQAIIEDMTLVSADSMFRQYEVSILWDASS